MIKLLIGGKGSGKTKALIELANKAVEESKGSVVCVEKGDALRLNVTSRARLISAEDYAICGADAFYGFIAGILSSNYDITDLFIDSSMKVVNTAGASGTDAELVVKVGETALGSPVKTTTTATDYTFEAETAVSGAVELKWTLTTAAVYIKSISVYTE